VRNARSKYHLSLGVSYPNARDAAAGLQAGTITPAQHDEIVDCIADGRKPPWDTPLGGEIMIHGCKNDRSGTAGCVALADEDIRELYPLIPLGAGVEIVP
jgi:murein L,D-transpeptidase YafK